MRKYMVFGWSEGADLQGPPDEFLGTTNKLVPEVPPTSNEDGSLNFGLTLHDEQMTMPKHLLNGNEHTLLVVTSYTEKSGIMNGRPIVAYLEIPNG
jgi:hypothetical protein